MKIYILFIAVLLGLSGCDDTPAPTGIKMLPVVDSPVASPITDTAKKGALKIDSLKNLTPYNSLGSGLTAEEMKDDSVFADGSIPSSWETAGITDVKAFKLFLKQVQNLVLNNEKEQLAEYITYPLGRSVKTKKDFIKHYDHIFSKDARLSVASLNFSQIFRNSNGAMSDGGKVWFAQIGKEFKIIAINN